MNSPESQADIFFATELEKRKSKLLYRTFSPIQNLTQIDFLSNDYLGFARQGKDLFDAEFLNWAQNQRIGSTGSRIVSGQSESLIQLEAECSEFFNSEACLFFQNGYLANLALLSTVAGRNDTYIYDEQCHVSLKDGMRLSKATKYPFRHNDPEDLKKKLRQAKGKIFIVTESIFSMAGDTCPLKEISEIAKHYDAHIILDEAHSTGTRGIGGRGLSNELGLEKEVWARIYTFGKALGASGGILAISSTTKEYLTNYAHPVIYSTAPMPLHAGICLKMLQKLQSGPVHTENLQEKIHFWNKNIEESGKPISQNLKSPVQYFRIAGNENALKLSYELQSLGYQVKAMLSPTVAPGHEQIRISLHSFNSFTDIQTLISILKEF